MHRKSNRQGKAITMRKIREIYRLNRLGFNNKEIARSVRCASATVRKFLNLFEESGLSMSNLESLSDTELQSALGIKTSRGPAGKQMASVDFSHVHWELSRSKAMTLQLLWEEYTQENPDNHYGYSWFCEHYKEFKRPLNATLRKNYKAGEFLFVDFSGLTIPYYDRQASCPKNAELFVAVLGCSNFTFARATESQRLLDFIDVHKEAFEYFGGVPQVIVPDNLKSATTKACIYDPDINTTYWDMARHYEVAICPARPYKPKDKAKAEAGVQLAQRWILAKLRNFKFFSVHEINEKIEDLLEQLNDRPFKKMKGSRRELFEGVEREALGSLPDQRYETASFKHATVNVDYHIRFDDNFYSVHYKLISQKVTIRATKHTIEILHNNQRVASHRRRYTKYIHYTHDEHRPPKHQAVTKWNPTRLRRWALGIGMATYKLIDSIFDSFKNEDHGIQRVLGILSLSSKFSNDALEAACKEANETGSKRLKYIRKIIEQKSEAESSKESSQKRTANSHENVRGPQYYKPEQSEVN